MIVLYRPLSAKEIKKYAKEVVAGVKFFEQKPRRRDCKVGVWFWYGEMLTVRRGHVEEDVNAAAKAAMKRKPPAKPKI